MATNLPTITDSRGQIYELTPDGVRRVEPDELSQSLHSRVSLVCMAIVIAVVLLRLFA